MLVEIRRVEGQSETLTDRLLKVKSGLELFGRFILVVTMQHKYLVSISENLTTLLTSKNRS